MSATSLIRWGGLAGVIAGALLLIADVWSLLDYLRYGDSQQFSAVATTTGFAIMSAMYLTGALLLLIALAGLYGSQSQTAGDLGVAGFLAALVGTGLLVALMWTIAFVAPSAAIEAPAFLDAEEVAGPLNMGFMISGIAFAIGWAIFGIATIRARVYPRAAAILLTIGALLTFLPFPATTLLFDLAVVWLGFMTLRSGARVPSVDQLDRETQLQAH
jgi:hypothetical protein